jgi:hypothetical protein
MALSRLHDCRLYCYPNQDTTLQNGGALEYAFEKVYTRIGKLKLHGAQFAEVTARIALHPSFNDKLSQ